MLRKIISAILIFCLSGTFVVKAETVEPVGNPGTFYAMAAEIPTVIETESLLKFPHVTQGEFNSQSPTQIATVVAEELKKLPEGYHAIYITSSTYGFEQNHDGLYDIRPSEEITLRMEKFAKALYEQGVEVDYLFDDYENVRHAGNMEEKTLLKLRRDGETVAETIEKNQHRFEEATKEIMLEYEQTDFYKEVIRPRLVEKGFTFGKEYELEYVNISPKSISSYTKEKYYQLADTLPEGADIAHDVFTEAVKAIQCDAYNECVLKPFQKYYPDIKVANYSYWIDSGEVPYTSMFNETAIMDGTPRLDNVFGNGSSPVFYGTFYNWQNEQDKYYPYGDMKVNSFNLLLQEWMQSIDIGHTSAKYDRCYAPWIMSKGASFIEGSLYWHNFRQTPYYEEAVTHFLLHGADLILYFPYTGIKLQDMKDITQTMKEMDYMCGFEDRKPVFFDNSDINEVPKWDQRYVLSGMYAGGRNVWRITPDLYTPGVSMESFCIDRANPTFQIGNQFIEFPEGSKIVEPEGDTKEYGYWVTSPAGTKPKQYRDLSLPEPDQQVDLVDGDEEPMGYSVKPVGNGVKSPFYDFTVQKKPVKEEKEDSEAVDKPEFNTIEIKPISFKNKVTPLVARDLPMDIEGHWSKDTMSHLYAIGVINGTEIGLEPDKELTKAEFLTMLFRALQVKSETYEGGIPDLQQGEWYADTVYTALNGGWISADAKGNVNAEKPLSREDMAVIMMKAIGEKEDAEQAVAHFTDEASISRDALSAVRQAVGLSILNGNADGSFSPKKICTRAEAATMIENYFVTLR